MKGDAAAQAPLLTARRPPCLGSIFKSANPERRARAIVEAVANYNDPAVIAKVSEDLGAPMVGINCDDMQVHYSKREGGAMHDQPDAKKAKPHGTW